MYPIKKFVTQLTFSREAHPRSSEILVVWDRERSSRSPRSEIEPWWTEFSNIFFGFIFFWFMSSLKSKFVFVILWIYVCGSVFERETLFFFSFFKDCMAKQWRTQRRRWVLLQVSWHSVSLQTIYGGFYMYMSNTMYKKRQC